MTDGVPGTLITDSSGMFLAMPSGDVRGVLERVKGMSLGEVDDEIIACDRAISPVVQYKAHLLYCVWVTNKWQSVADDEGHPIYTSFIDYCNKLTEREKDEVGVGHSPSFYWHMIEGIKIQVGNGIPLEEARPLSSRVLNEVRNLGTVGKDGKIALKPEVKASPWMPGEPDAPDDERVAELLRDAAIIKPKEALARFDDIMGRSVLFPANVEWFDLPSGYGVAFDVMDEQGELHVHIEGECLTDEGRRWLASRNGVEEMR